MEYLSEEIKKKSYELLDESLGSFERQHVLAREIACAAYESAAGKPTSLDVK